MPTTDVACPYCGAETAVTVPSDQNIRNVYKTDLKGNISAACGDGHKFSIRTK
jgi:hypothetical protein